MILSTHNFLFSFLMARITIIYLTNTGSNPNTSGKRNSSIRMSENHCTRRKVLARNEKLDGWIKTKQVTSKGRILYVGMIRSLSNIRSPAEDMDIVNFELARKKRKIYLFKPLPRPCYVCIWRALGRTILTFLRFEPRLCTTSMFYYLYVLLFYYLPIYLE